MKMSGFTIGQRKYILYIQKFNIYCQTKYEVFFGVNTKNSRILDYENIFVCGKVIGIAKCLS